MRFGVVPVMLKRMRAPPCEGLRLDRYEIAACGGGGGGVVHNPGTPLGTYPVTITATIGGVTQTGSVSLTVN